MILETQKPFYEVKNEQILHYEFKYVLKYIENKEEF